MLWKSNEEKKISKYQYGERRRRDSKRMRNLRHKSDKADDMEGPHFDSAEVVEADEADGGAGGDEEVRHGVVGELARLVVARVEPGGTEPRETRRNRVPFVRIRKEE